jgi:hypothetical protein
VKERRILRSYEIEVEVKGVYSIVAKKPEQAREITKEEIEYQLMKLLRHRIGTKLQVYITDVSPSERVRFFGNSIPSFDVFFSIKGVVVQTSLNKTSAIKAAFHHLESKLVKMENVAIDEFSLWVDKKAVA